MGNLSLNEMETTEKKRGVFCLSGEVGKGIWTEGKQSDFQILPRSSSFQGIMLALLFQFLSVFIFLLMAEFYCDQTLQFWSIYFAAEWIMKSAFTAVHGAQRSWEEGLLAADKAPLQNKALAVKHEKEAWYWI